MRFEWDSRKANSNLTKHDVSFEEAATVFGDPFSLTISDRDHSDTEERFVLLERSYRTKLLVVVFTERGENTRVISARPASRRERKIYEENS
jgi:uncharacterized protein